MSSELSLLKPAARFLGVAESGLLGAVDTILGGVVMRADLILDGLVWRKATLRGLDASEAVIEMIQQLDRQDLNGIMLHGSVIAGYNVIDMIQLYSATKLPVISVTKAPQENLKEHLISTFPSDWEIRWEIVLRNGVMKPIKLDTESTVFVQFIGCSWETVKGVINRLTRFGGIPEPLRVARLLARALMKSQSSK
ncbi:MAG: DUF99 family protein [Candidatus Thorarchaeota archaeon]